MDLTIVRVDKVSRARVLCDAHDILHNDDIYKTSGVLEGPLETCENLIVQLIGYFKFHLQRLQRTLNQTYDRVSSIEVRNLLT